MKGHAVQFFFKVETLLNNAFNPILTGLFESKFLLGGGGGQFDPPFAAKFAWMSRHVKSIATTFFWRKTVYLLCYYDLCKLDA